VLNTFEDMNLRSQVPLDKRLEYRRENLKFQKILTQYPEINYC